MPLTNFNAGCIKIGSRETSTRITNAVIHPEVAQLNRQRAWQTQEWASLKSLHMLPSSPLALSPPKIFWILLYEFIFITATEVQIYLLCVGGVSLKVIRVSFREKSIFRGNLKPSWEKDIYSGQQLAVGGLAWVRALDQMTSRGPFQTKPFCDSIPTVQ